MHPIELSKTWSLKNLDRLLVFCFLDRATPYEKVCLAFNNLDREGLTVRKNLRKASLNKIVKILKDSGYRFYNQSAVFIKEFGKNKIDLRTATREELTKIPGIGMKLASMFLRNTRGEDYAVIDVHLKRFLKEKGKLGKNYLENEKNLKEIAKEMGMSVAELDYLVWEERRIGNRKKKK